MFKLELIGARSYNGIVTVTAKKPFAVVETEREVERLLATGYFRLCGDEAEAATEAATEESADFDLDARYTINLEKLTKAELTEYAAKLGISLDGCKTKAEMLEAISIAVGGSATMIELQE